MNFKGARHVYSYGKSASRTRQYIELPLDHLDPDLYQNLIFCFCFELDFFHNWPLFWQDAVFSDSVRFRLVTDLHNVCLSAANSKKILQISSLSLPIVSQEEGHITDLKNPTKFDTYFCKEHTQIHLKGHSEITG